MPAVVRRIMRHGSNRESIVVQILRIVQQCLDKIAAAKIVREIAKEFIAVWVVAHVLNDGATVGVSMGAAKLVPGGSWKTREEQGADICIPGCINNGFVG